MIKTQETGRARLSAATNDRASQRTENERMAYHNKHSKAHPGFLPHRQWVSIGTVPPAPPKLHELIHESGIWQILEQEEALKEFEVVNDKSVSLVDQTLKDVMTEVLTMDHESTHSLRDGALHEQTLKRKQPVVLPNPISLEKISEPKTCQLERQQLSTLLPSSGDKHTYLGCIIPEMGEMEPSRSSSQQRGPLGMSRPPLDPAYSAGKRSFLPEPTGKADDRPIPSRVGQFDSMTTNLTMLSDITLPYEIAKAQSELILDPRAPQYEMAMEQQRLRECRTTDATVRTGNHRTGTGSPDALMPPTRRPTPEKPDAESRTPQQNDLPPRTRNAKRHNIDPHASTPDFGFPRPHDARPQLATKAKRGPVARRGSVGGVAAMQPMTSQPQGPFISPNRTDQRAFVLPRTPQQNANPLLFPANLLVSPEKCTETSPASIVGPFVSPSAVIRRYRPMPDTPEHNSNPLLFPQGISYYPNSPAVPDTPPIESRGPNAQALDGAVSHHSKKTSLQLPFVDEDNEPDKQTVSPQDAPPLRESFSSVCSMASTRVKMNPREILHVGNDGDHQVCSGCYSGPINRHDQMHGNGVFWFATGDLYLGQFRKGELHGVGAISIRQEDGSIEILRGFFRHNEYIGTEPLDDFY